MQEYICRDGRMSVNGICAIDQKNSTEAYNTTQNIIDESKNDRVSNNLDTEKGSFSWDMDKPSKVENFTNTISKSINEYNNFIEQNLGISSVTQNTLRAATSIGAITSGGTLTGVLGPFALPAIIGNAMLGKKNESLEKLTDQDRQGENKDPIDMMTYDIPNYNDSGFNIHNDGGNNQDFGGGASYDNAASTGAKDGFGYGL